MTLEQKAAKICRICETFKIDFKVKVGKNESFEVVQNGIIFCFISKDGSHIQTVDSIMSKSDLIDMAYIAGRIQELNEIHS